MAYVIGIDGGTESLRAHVFDMQGRSLGSAAAPYETRFPAPGRAEQDPQEWWRALGEAVRGALAASGVSADAIRGIGLDTTSCTVVALDADGRPLRPAILWMDMRAADEARDVLATGDPALCLNGGGRGPVSAEWMIPKALWLSRHEPEIFARAATICEYQDYLVFHLTGERVASLDNIAMRWHYRARDGGWPESLVAALGIEALLEKWPRRVVAPGEPVATLTEAAAAHLGLPRDVVVAQGGADAFIGMIGLGVSAPGQLALITGSSHLQLGVSPGPLAAPGLWGAYADAVYPGRWIVEGGQTSTGSIVAWLRRLLGAGGDLEILNEKAASLAPGADGLVLLDHFQGNRTPHTDPHSRGAIVGLTLAHGPEHLFRAALEGISFGTQAVLEAMRRGGVPVQELTMGGGATRSPLWVQIHADVAGLPVRIPRFAEAPSLGSGILAAVSIGLFPTIDEAIAQMVTTDRVVEPDPERVAIYRELYEGYERLYPALRDWRAGPSASTQ